MAARTLPRVSTMSVWKSLTTSNRPATATRRARSDRSQSAASWAGTAAVRRSAEAPAPSAAKGARRRLRHRRAVQAQGELMDAFGAQRSLSPMSPSTPGRTPSSGWPDELAIGLSPRAVGVLVLAATAFEVGAVKVGVRHLRSFVRTDRPMHWDSARTTANAQRDVRGNGHVHLEREAVFQKSNLAERCGEHGEIPGARRRHHRRSASRPPRLCPDVDPSVVASFQKAPWPNV
jgi:hypothetical protein